MPDVSLNNVVGPPRRVLWPCAKTSGYVFNQDNGTTTNVATEADALAAMQAAEEANRQAIAAAALADKTAATDLFNETSYATAGNTTTKPTQPVKKKAPGKKKLTAKEKKERGVRCISLRSFLTPINDI